MLYLVWFVGFVVGLIFGVMIIGWAAYKYHKRETEALERKHARLTIHNEMLKIVLEKFNIHSM